jgi:hypothetical protein
MVAHISTNPYKRFREFKEAIRQTWRRILYARCLYCSCTCHILAKFHKFAFISRKYLISNPALRHFLQFTNR